MGIRAGERFLFYTFSACFSRGTFKRFQNVYKSKQTTLRRWIREAADREKTRRSGLPVAPVGLRFFQYFFKKLCRRFF